MAVIKNIPTYIDTDSDERLLEDNGAMPIALNYFTKETTDGGDGGVGKNGKSNVPGTPFSISDEEDIDGVYSSRFVVGKAEDSEKSKIYYFVQEVGGNFETSSIYEYDTVTDLYRLVLRNKLLNFNIVYPVKADVINIEPVSGLPRTILYFTDNFNPPRKVNVDYALSGLYNGLSNNEWEYTVNTIKAPSVYSPSVSFEKDETVNHNNFKGSVFQFAVQVIYRDGEESAISPYSKLAKPDQLSFDLLEEQAFFSLLDDNVCKISLNLPDSLKESQNVSKVRLMAREGNLGNFFIVDEFDPKVIKTRSVYGQNTLIYNPSSQTYRFYNDVLDGIVPTLTVDKLYDNVPLKAEGQTIAGNRLMYSNYEEGYNVGNVSANITPIYSNGNTSEGFVFNDFAAIGLGFNEYPNFSLDINQISEALELDGVVPAGSVFELTLPFAPQLEAVFPEDPDESIFTFSEFNVNSLGFLEVAPGQLPETITVQVASELSVEQFAELVAFEISQISPVVAYTQTLETQGSNLVYASTDLDQFDNLANQMNAFGFGAPNNPFGDPDSVENVDIAWEFDTSVDNNIINVVPSISAFSGPYRVFFDGIFELQYYLEGFNSNLSLLGDQNTIFTQMNQPFQATFSASTFIEGFKSGALHKLGVVYYDKFNRSSFVKELGTTYVGWYNDFDRIKQEVLDEGVEFNIGQDLDENVATPGPAAIQIEFTSEPPEWADTYQIVYPGNSTMDSYTQYTVGNAFPARKGDLDEDAGFPHRDVNESSKRLYVSLETLDRYKDEKGGLIDYSFSEGDRLRVVSWKAGDDGGNAPPSDLYDIYPSATDGSAVEFEVVGVEFLDKTADNPIAFNQPNGPGTAYSPYTALTDIEDKFTGTFIVLEHAAITSGSTTIDGDQLKYRGFDWFAIANDFADDGSGEEYPYPDGEVGALGGNHWYKECLVEIYNPKENTAQEFYYEIGEVRPLRPPKDINSTETEHGPAFLLTSGDVHYRPTPCLSSVYQDEDDDDIYNWNFNDLDDWGYPTKFVESERVSDLIDEKMWDRGRPHVRFDSGGRKRYKNQITWSDAYAEGVENLPYSSFNATLANFYSLESRYGACRYISSYGGIGDELIAIQENKLSKSNLDRRIITDAAGSQSVALTSDVIGGTTYYAGDYGCGNNPESVSIYNNSVVFADPSRRKILRFINSQLVPISDKNVASLVNKAFEDWPLIDAPDGARVRRIVTGYDPDDEMIYVTWYGTERLQYGPDAAISPDVYTDLNSFAEVGFGVGKDANFGLPFLEKGATLSYDIEQAKWTSLWSFIPDIYASVDNSMYTCKHVDYQGPDDGPLAYDLLFFKHEHSDIRCNYYMQQRPWVFSVSANNSPSTVKTFNACSVEGTNLNSSSFIARYLASDGAFSDLIDDTTWVKKENTIYSRIPKDVSAISTDHLVHIGLTELSSNTSIKQSSPSYSVPVPPGAEVLILQDGVLQPPAPSTTFIASLQPNGDITLNDGIVPEVFVEGVQFETYLALPQSFNGDPIRGHYAKAYFLSSVTSPVEVYCVNTETVESVMHHK